MPALSLIRGWSVAILLSSVPRLSLAQVFNAFSVDTNPSPVSNIQNSVQTTQYSFYSTISQGALFGSPPSASTFTIQTVSTDFNGVSTSIWPTAAATVSVGTTIEVYTTMASSFSPIEETTLIVPPPSNTPVSGSAPPLATPISTGISSFVQFSSSAFPALETQLVTFSSPIPASGTSSSLFASITATSSTLSFPATVSNFEWVGCVASTSGYEGFQLSENTTAMSISRCIPDCSTFAYAGMFDTLCFCANNDVSSSVISTAQGSCNQPCPGNPAEICGGRISGATRILKRQSSLADILLTLYANPAIVNDSPSSTPSSTTSPIPLSTSSTINLPSAPLPPQTNSSTVSVHTVILTTIYTDICSTGYTTKTTILSTAHCGCTLPGATAIQTPSIPMTTVEKICTVCPAAGAGHAAAAGAVDNSPGTVTLTLPDTSAISSASANAVAVAGSVIPPAVAPAASGTVPSQDSPSSMPMAGEGSAVAGGTATSPPAQGPPPSTSSSPSNDNAAGSPGVNSAVTTDARRITLTSIPTESPVYMGGATRMNSILSLKLGFSIICLIISAVVR